MTSRRRQRGTQRSATRGRRALGGGSAGGGRAALGPDWAAAEFGWLRPK
jgi:hypothetical protein